METLRHSNLAFCVLSQAKGIFFKAVDKLLKYKKVGTRHEMLIKNLLKGVCHEIFDLQFFS